MTSLPPIPPWDGLHPLIIHFPIALLLIAPFFLLAGALVKPEKGRPYLFVALALMALGTIGTWVAVSTGEAAGELATRNEQINSVIEQHEGLAEKTRNTFTVLTVVFAALVVLPRFTKAQSSRIFSTALPLVFLVAYGAGSVLLANTAHQGGRLVHELGVTAMVAPTPTGTGTDAALKAPSPEAAEHED